MESILSKARWIWLPEGEGLNQYGDFRCEFFRPDAAKKIRLYISVDSRYSVTVNGVHINGSQYADYSNHKVYDVLDISAQAVHGRNVLAITAWFQGEDCSVYRLGKAGLLFAVESDDVPLAVSSKEVMCRPSAAYISGDMERFSPQLSFSFRYNAAAEDDWESQGFLPEGAWTPAAETGAVLPLYPRPVLPLTLDAPKPAVLLAQGTFIDPSEDTLPCGERIQRAYLSARPATDMGIPSKVKLPADSPVTLTNDQGGGLYVLVDLEREEAGVLHLDIDLPGKADVFIGFGEHLDDMRPRTYVGGRQFAAVYHGKAGRQTFTHYYKRLGCRYLLLLVYVHKFTLYYAGVRPTEYPVKYRSEFQCADGLHNRIAEVSRRTLELCMHEHYEDCPWREQAMYAMDSRNQMLCGYYAFGEVPFAQASLRLLAGGMRGDGLLELCAPARVSVVIPSFSLNFVVAVKENVEYSGDMSFGREMLPTVERLLATFISRRNGAGLVTNFTNEDSWNFFEWREGLDGAAREGTDGNGLSKRQDLDAPLSAYLSLALSAASDLCGWLGDLERQRRYAALWLEVNTALEAFWNEDMGLYATHITPELGHYSELTQSLMICAGVPSPERQSGILEKLIAENNGMIPITLSSSIYKYDALMKDSRRYGAWCIRQIGDIWGKMLFSGATSFWETELGADDFDRAGSLCHGWSAVPLYVYYRYVLGEQLSGDIEPQVFCGLYEPRRKCGK